MHHELAVFLDQDKFDLAARVGSDWLDDATTEALVRLASRIEPEAPKLASVMANRSSSARP